ncbi:hypothetical protein ACFLT2_15170, partial [Acidobacteriota bacterium]
YQTQIIEASRRAKCKKVLYLYDDTGDRHLLGIFSKRKALEIKKHLADNNKLDRLSEFEIRTTEPDSDYEF